LHGRLARPFSGGGQLADIIGRPTFLGTIGYIECEDGSLEPGFEKIAIYAVQETGGGLTPTHAAKQLADGRWTSKLGPYEDIEHTLLENVNCPTYGAAVAYLKRSRPQAN
jgi:hypothetical protein